MAPTHDRGRIYVVPADTAGGDRLVQLINKSMKLPGHHKIQANWNHELPHMAQITLRYKSLSTRDPRVLIEDPKKGIALLNNWELKGREIIFVNFDQDPKTKGIVFVRVLVSKRIAELIKAQRGQVWISGGIATAQWNRQDLVPGLEVIFNPQ